MPTSHPRAAITLDPALAESVDSARRALGDDMGRSELLRQLILKGVERVVEEEAERQKAPNRLADLFASDDFLDRDVLMRIDELAWGIQPEPEPEV